MRNRKALTVPLAFSIIFLLWIFRLHGLSPFTSEQNHQYGREDFNRNSALTRESETVNRPNYLEMFEDVTAATAYRYCARDDQGCSLDTIKIVENPMGGYIGIYHSRIKDVFYVRLALSSDLLHWSFVKTIEEKCSQPTIARSPNGAYIVAFEKEDLGSHINSHIKLHYYSNISSLIYGFPMFMIDVPRTLSYTNEGTPNVYNVSIENCIMSICLGFHYNNVAENVDENAIGWLTVSLNKPYNWTWRSISMKEYCGKLRERYGVRGNIGDRDHGEVFGKNLTMQEGNLRERRPDTDWSAWRIFIYDHSNGNFTMLNIRTHRGSTSFGNPAFTILRSPNKRTSVVVTHYVFSEGAAEDEAGTLIFYKEADHDVSIVNVSVSCNSKVKGSLHVHVAVENNGGLTENCSLGVNYTRILDPLIGSQNVTLAPSTSATLTFTWKPSLAGRYKISAYTSEVLNDIDPENNRKEVEINLHETYCVFHGHALIFGCSMKCKSFYIILEI